MLGVTPARFMRGDVALGGVLEGDRLGRLDPGGFVLAPSGGERIDGVDQRSPLPQGFLAGFG
jgi:hypothetical protein